MASRGCMVYVSTSELRRKASIFMNMERLVITKKLEKLKGLKKLEKLKRLRYEENCFISIGYGHEYDHLCTG
jgi:hypothetical protein